MKTNEEIIQELELFIKQDDCFPENESYAVTLKQVKRERLLCAIKLALKLKEDQMKEAVSKALPKKKNMNEVHSFYRDKKYALKIGKRKVDVGNSAYDYCGGMVNGYNECLDEFTKALKEQGINL